MTQSFPLFPFLRKNVQANDLIVLREKALLDWLAPTGRHGWRPPEAVDRG